MKKISIFRLAVLLIVLTALSAKLQAQSTFSTYIYNTNCNGIDTIAFAISSCTPGDTVVELYGDGTSLRIPVYCSGSSGSAYGFSHYFTAPGTYGMKFILLSGGVPIDSILRPIVVSCMVIKCSVYNDVNSDCSFDSGDRYLCDAATLEIDSAGVPIDTITTTYGIWYPSNGSTGMVYAFKVITNPYGYTISCMGDTVVYDTLGVTATIPSIGFICNPAASFDLAVSANFSAGLTGAGSHISITNSSCTATTGVALTIDYSPKYVFSFFWTGDGGGTYPYTISGNSVTFNIGDVSMDSTKYFVAGFDPVGTLTLGDTVNTTFHLTPIIGDYDSINNIIVTCDTIRASHDPNYKSVTPAGNIDPGTLLKYIISFENTGNDTAFNIHIMDTLSDNLDINTFEMVSATAPVNVIPLTWGGHNIMKFDFPNINLLDTAQHHDFDGMVTYTIKAKTGLAAGTKIDNMAGIYFDVNPVVMTNNVENVIGTPLSVAKPIFHSLQLFPNPAATSITIISSESINNITISNIVGQTVYSNEFNTNKVQVGVSELPTGVYFVKINGTEVRKFIKQ